MDHNQNAPVPGPPMPGPPPTDPDQPGREQADVPDRAQPSPESVETAAVPGTGDIVVDATLRDLAAVEQADLDATLAAGESVHATLTARLSDLGT